jgi:hypothetical protein
MKARTRVLLVLAALLAIQLACNLPAQSTDATQIPAPNQTLTALFAITPDQDATPTLPPVVTATLVSGSNPTATQAPILAETATSAPTTAAQPTTAPTATSVPPTAAPQFTPTIPDMRPRGGVVAKYMSTPPTIDGDWSEWKDKHTEYPATNVVYGRENWTGPDDLAASFYVGWDDNNLYIAVKVRDDQYVQNMSGENIFQGDSVEILLDTKLKEDFYYTQLSPDDFQLGLSPGRGVGGPDTDTKEAYRWFPSNIAGKQPDFPMATIQQQGVWRLEAAIPWSVFETKPTAGTNMGFVLSVSDNDDPNRNVQQSMVSNVAGRRLTDPTTWGNIRFER